MILDTDHRRNVFALLADGKWHSTVEINRVGGTEGTRRLRELRADGALIEGRRKAYAHQWEYRLILPKFEEGSL